MKHMPVSGVMRRKVVTASSDMSLHDAATLMHEHGINGLPVVDEGGRVVGVVGIKDILRVPYRSGDEIYIWTGAPLTRIAGYLRDMRVADIMARRPLCVQQTDVLSTVVGMMINQGIHPIPIVDKDARLVGVIGRADVLGVVLSTPVAEESGATRTAAPEEQTAR